MTRAHGRRIPLAGTYNFRDAGGYPVSGGRVMRRGVVFRSDNLSRLAPSAHPEFRRLGIRTIVDFRTHGERTRRPNRLPANLEIREEAAPVRLMPGDDARAGERALTWQVMAAGPHRFTPDLIHQIYRELGERAAPALSLMFQVLLDPANHPVLVMCAGGKDRTGFAVAMLHQVLGVPMEHVQADYLLSGTLTEPLVERALRVLRVASLFRVPRPALRALLLARPEYLEGALAAVNAAHGTLEHYVERHLGLRAPQRERLRELLLEPGAEGPQIW